MEENNLQHPREDKEAVSLKFYYHSLLLNVYLQHPKKLDVQ